MSVYNKERSKIYSDLLPTVQSQQEVDQQNYSLAKISDMGAYL